MKITRWCGRHWYLRRQNSQLQITETEAERELTGRILAHRIIENEGKLSLKIRHESRNDRSPKSQQSCDLRPGSVQPHVARF